jgi:hypothetical protein
MIAINGNCGLERSGGVGLGGFAGTVEKLLQFKSNTIDARLKNIIGPFLYARASTAEFSLTLMFHVHPKLKW